MTEHGFYVIVITTVLLEKGEKSGVRKRGFTLLELVIVIAIVGIFVAIAIPSIGAAVENQKYLKDIQNADLMSKALDAAKVSFISEADIDMGAVTAAVVGSGFSVQTESESAAFIYVRETGTIYAVKAFDITRQYDLRYRKYRQASFTDSEGVLRTGYLLGADSLTDGNGTDLQGIVFRQSDSVLYIERYVNSDGEEIKGERLEAVFNGNGVENIPEESIRWTSSNENAVKISDTTWTFGEDSVIADCLLTVESYGTSVITVSAEGYGLYAQILVSTDVRPTNIEVTVQTEGETQNHFVIKEETLMLQKNGSEPEKWIPVGTEFTLEAKGIYQYGDVTLIPSSEQVEYSIESGNDVVALEEETGGIKIIGVGDAVIAITSKYQSSNPDNTEASVPFSRKILVSGYVPLDIYQISLNMEELTEENPKYIAAKPSDEGISNAVLVELSEDESGSGYLSVPLTLTAAIDGHENFSGIDMVWNCEKNNEEIAGLMIPEEDAFWQATLTISEPGIYEIILTVSDSAGNSEDYTYWVLATERLQDVIVIKNENSDAVRDEEDEYYQITAGFGERNSIVLENVSLFSEGPTSFDVDLMKLYIKRGAETIPAASLDPSQLESIQLSPFSKQDTTNYSLSFSISTYINESSIRAGDLIFLPISADFTYLLNDDSCRFSIPLMFTIKMKE